MSRKAAAGRGPRGSRKAPARDRRSRAPQPRRAPARPATAARRTPLTGRAAILALALAFVIVAIALPFKIWLSQRGDLSSLNSQIRQAQSRVAELNAQDQKWNNPAYVEAQARKRLHYVMPGESNRVVLGPKPSHRQQAIASAIAHPAAPPVSDGPWYSQLWQSMQTAGDPSANSSGKS
ncbi:MAG: FtsB family cell division protein [Mycobacteriales bacterium]